MVESKSQAKSFGIDKRVVWEAWKQVRADRGAAGVDEEAVAQFERYAGDLVVHCKSERQARLVRRSWPGKP